MSTSRAAFLRRTFMRARAALPTAALLCFAFAAQAEESPWLLRVRAVQLDSRNADTTGLGLSINNKLIPEFDISYAFTEHWSTELVLTYPQKQELRSQGNQIGSLKHLPPTWTLQYHLTGWGSFHPYLGAGVNYTRFSSVRFSPAVEAALHPSVKKDSFGWALQVGADYDIGTRSTFNVDVKKVQIGTKLDSAGNSVGRLKVDPWLIGIGFGYRF